MWSIKPEDKDLIEKAKRFMEKYYRTFDANRADLVNLFREESVLAFEGQQIKGKEAILAKLTSIPECHNEIADFNCLRHRTPGSMLVWVCGQTWVGGTKDKADAVLTNQMFHLMPTSLGGFYVGTQIWRPFDLNKLRTSLAAPPMSASAPAPASVLALPMSTSASSESASTLPISASASSESALAPPISASASSESALALPISMMKIFTLGPPMSTMKHP
ncbi:nuclear transport factor 2B-like isoform X3 [Eucalyptus grandis]|uniref:nuclear transport factor 2B-like isoform X3 n=1 Tax=Eucalyptus grandis TaxID=71139 RepID=UPI00192F0126|nr:nuclear transport factor 2B-like isoform X3 [Eucalyptus grandis]